MNQHNQHNSHIKLDDKITKNPCIDKLSDLEYLEHMIPHHQVAIDMSKRLLLYTNNSYLLEFCRKLILEQQAGSGHLPTPSASTG